MKSVHNGRILPNFRHIRDFIGFLVACKNEEDPVKNERAKSGHKIIH